MHGLCLRMFSCAYVATYVYACRHIAVWGARAHTHTRAQARTHVHARARRLARTHRAVIHHTHVSLVYVRYKSMYLGPHVPLHVCASCARVRACVHVSAPRLRALRAAADLRIRRVAGVLRFFQRGHQQMEHRISVKHGLGTRHFRPSVRTAPPPTFAFVGSQAFYDSRFNGDISKWNTASVSDMNYVCAAFSRRRAPRRTRSAGVGCGAECGATLPMMSPAWVRPWVCARKRSSSRLRG
jgi:surface protein